MMFVSKLQCPHKASQLGCVLKAADVYKTLPQHLCPVQTQTVTTEPAENICILLWFTWEKCFPASFRGKPRSGWFPASPTTTAQVLCSIYWPEKSIIHTQLYLREFRQPLSGSHNQEFFLCNASTSHSPAVHTNIYACFLHSRSASEGQVLDIKMLAKCSTSFINASLPAAMAQLTQIPRGSAAEDSAA